MTRGYGKLGDVQLDYEPEDTGGTHRKEPKEDISPV